MEIEVVKKYDFKETWITYLRLLGEGLTYKEIDARMNKKVRHAENQFQQMRNMLDCKTNTQLIFRCVQMGILKIKSITE